MKVYRLLGPALFLPVASLGCAPGAQQLNVVATEMRFEPERISIPAGRAVRLVLRNQGALVHDFSVAGPGFSSSPSHVGGHSGDQSTFSVHAKPKQEAAIEFTATLAGRYEFYCAEPGHKDAGMKGTLLVR